MNIKNLALIASLAVVIFATVSCSDSSQQDISQQDISQQGVETTTPSSSEQSSSASKPSSTSNIPQNNTTPTPKPALRPSLAPVPVFTPDSTSVQQAFASALLATYEKTPPSLAREQWLRSEEAKLRTLQALSCTPSTPGTVSTCQINFNNTQAQVKVILTQAGWRLVR